MKSFLRGGGGGDGGMHMLATDDTAFLFWGSLKWSWQ